MYVNMIIKACITTDIIKLINQPSNNIYVMLD